MNDVEKTAKRWGLQSAACSRVLLEKTRKRNLSRLKETGRKSVNLHNEGISLNH